MYVIVTTYESGGTVVLGPFIDSKSAKRAAKDLAYYGMPFEVAKCLEAKAPGQIPHRVWKRRE
jgi:hypothetical protein